MTEYDHAIPDNYNFASYSANSKASNSLTICLVIAVTM